MIQVTRTSLDPRVFQCGSNGISCVGIGYVAVAEIEVVD
jgi:hypothetical protein